jgi:hypothetical protein
MNMLRESSEMAAERFCAALATADLPATITAYPLADDTVELTNFLASQPGHGQGRTSMQFILDLADRLGVTLEVWPVYDDAIEGGLDQDDLFAWYKRLGFDHIPNRDPDSDMEMDQYIVRKPSRVW